MHLDRLQLENFGMYHRRLLELGQADLILLYGPNESGKTTALNGLRQALFGFRARTPYLTAGRTMSAEVSGRLANGQTLVFTRRKGRQDEVEGSLAGRAIEAAEILRQLGNLDLGSYEQLFGFSLEELRRGEEALKSAQLSEALAGGGLTGIHSLHLLRSDLQTTLAELYKPRGSRSLINLQLNEIQNIKSELSKVQVLPSAVEELQRQRQHLYQQGEQLKEEHASLFQFRAETQRLLEMFPNFRRYLQLKQQLAHIRLPEGIDVNFVNNWSEHSETRKHLLVALDHEVNQLRQDQLMLESLGGASEFAEFEDVIEQLGHQTEEIALLRQRAIDLRASIDDSRTICRRLCEILQLDAVDDAIRAFVMTPPVRRELEKISHEAHNIAEKEIANTALWEAAQRSLAALRTQTDDQPLPNNLDELAYSIRELEAAEANHQALAGILAELAQSPTMLQLEQQLQASVGCALKSSWDLPSSQTVRQFALRCNDLLNQRSQLSKELSALEASISEAELNLGDLDQSLVEQTLNAIQRNRSEREQCFESWENDLAQPLIAASITPEQQYERLERLHQLALQADQLQQTLMESAEAVASHQAGQRQLAILQENLQKQQLLANHMQQQLIDAEVAWQELWGGYGILPLQAESMLDWLAGYSRWQEHQQRLASARRELHLAGGLVKQLRHSLIDHWPTSLREDIAVEVLNSRVVAWQNAQRDAQRDAGLLNAAQQQVDQLVWEAEQLAKKRRDLDDRYQSWLASAPISHAWPIEQVMQLTDALERLRREDEIVRKSEMELLSIEQRLQSFDRDLQRLARQLNEELSATVAGEILVRRWFEEVLLLRDQRLQRARLTAAIDYRQKRVAELTLEKDALDERLAGIISAAGSTDVLGMSMIAELVQRAEQLQQEISECLATMQGQAAGQELSGLMEQLSQTDEIRLRLVVEEFTRQLDQVDRQRKETDQSIGNFDQRIEQMARSEEAGRLALELHHQRSRLGELCEQWVIHRLAAELLDRAVDRFSREHEPVLLQYTRDFLQRLTGGRYQTVEHDSANPTQFLVRNTSGQSFEPERLSTGTREQLYLAIRMAFITHYCESHEPLPVIMDDCFVNFDDSRTAHALAAISQWKIAAQRIVLSCHFRVVQCLAEIAPHTPCIHLERDERMTVGELASETLLKTQ